MRKLPPLTLQDFIRDIGEIPYCQCKECQTNKIKVNINITQRGYRDYKRKGYPKFIRGHKSEQWKELHSKNMRKELHPNYKPEVHNRTFDQIVSELGEPPICACPDCQKTGQRVNIQLYRYNEYKNRGYPQYINGHYNPMSHPEIVYKVAIKLTGRSFSNETIKKMSKSKKLWFKTHEHPRGNKNKHPSQEVRNKISIANSGLNNGNYDPNVHKTLDQMISELGEIPYCQCDSNNGKGCGQKVNVDPKCYTGYKENGYPKFIVGHSSRGKKNPMYGTLAPHPKKVFPHLTPFQGEILMHRWDRLYAQYLDSIGELYVYESRPFEMVINNKFTTYIPDFYLPIQRKFVEIKGYWRDDAKLKSDKFHSDFCQNWSYEVLMKKDLEILGINLKITPEEQGIINEYEKRNKDYKEINI